MDCQLVTANSIKDNVRIAILAFDFPYPPNRGGRADIWRRLLTLRALGHRVMLVAWSIPGHEPTAQAIATVKEQVDHLFLFPARHGAIDALMRLVLLARWPSYASARRLSDQQNLELNTALRDFSPNLIWCEGPYPGAAAETLSHRTGVPLVYRSHNIEHQYMRKQASAARHWRDRFAWRLACVGLEKFEQRLMAQAAWVFDISYDDMAYWRLRGHGHSSWLPPVAESALVQQGRDVPVAESARNDVVFLGNLTTPNNVRGVEWLVQEIRPLVLARRPGTRFLVAGSNPGPHVQQLCTAHGVELLANVADALALFRSARVLVNPVRTGSGTHVKAIEMLMMRAPIVTASQGTMGLPPEVKHLFRIADRTEAFADQVLDALAAPQDEWVARAAARRLFGLQGVADAMAHLQSQVLPSRRAEAAPATTANAP